MAAIFTLIFALVMFQVSFPAVIAISVNYYDYACPKLETTVTNVVKKAMKNDKTVPAPLLRMHFHDCFIRVSALLALSM